MTDKKSDIRVEFERDLRKFSDDIPEDWDIEMVALWAAKWALNYRGDELSKKLAKELQ